MPKILWHETRAFGFTDVLPAEWFSEEGTTADCVHQVTGPSGRIYEARCDVIVKMTTAELDYEAHAAFNRERDMYPGVLRLEFTGPDRRDVAKVWWRDPGGDFEHYTMTIS